jgi:hypothetical protein
MLALFSLKGKPLFIGIDKSEFVDATPAKWPFSLPSPLARTY